MLRCPICGGKAGVIDSEPVGLRVDCEVCGPYAATGEVLDYLEYNARGAVGEKTRRWLRETRDVGLRMISSAPVRMDDPNIRDYVTVHQLRNMYLRTGTREEYEAVLENCLTLQKKLGRECLTIEEARDAFPTVDERETAAMIRKMAAAGDLAVVQEDGRDCISVPERSNVIADGPPVP